MSSTHKKEDVNEANVFEEVKQEVSKLLCNYRYEEEGKARLYIIDDKAMEIIKDLNKTLFEQYANKPDLYKIYNLGNIVKIINMEKPSHWYRVFSAFHWKEINDQKLVFERLSGELERHFNKLKVNVKKRLSEKEITQDIENQILIDINNEQEVARKELDYIVKNKDILTVRISAYFRRKEYPRIDFKINKVRQTAIGLKITTANALWFKELKENEKPNTSNKLIEFFKEAKNPFGDVFYKIKDSE